MTKISDNDGYLWLEGKLENIKPRTKMYYFLKLYLKPQGYWKHKRGKRSKLMSFKALK